MLTTKHLSSFTKKEMKSITFLSQEISLTLQRINASILKIHLTLQRLQVLSQGAVVGLATSWLPPLQNTILIIMKRLVVEMERFWHLVVADLTSFKFSFLHPNTFVHFLHLWCAYKWSIAGFWKVSTLVFYLPMIAN
jgi:hypothetical protein